MRKNKEKNSFITSFLWFVLMGFFLSLTVACSAEDDWIPIGELAEDAWDVEMQENETCSEQTEGLKLDSVDIGVEEDENGAGGNTTPPSPVSIKVYVCGAVIAPGVVNIPQGSRVEAALNAAGGFAENAAKDKVNLAAWVTDGQMLYFPMEGEDYEELPEIAESKNGLVNINTANVAELCTLPGIGESRAADIIAYREENGGFVSGEDIMKVPGIKNAVYEKLKDKITVN